MYLPRAFAEIDLAALDALVARDSFITLVTVRDGVPSADHLPVLYRRDGERIELRGHVSRANPVGRHRGHVLAIVNGPNAYVSPSWYPDKDEAARVPTWNYATAHLEGELQTFSDEASLAAVVDQLSLLHEAAVGSDWRYEHEREDQRSQLRGIIGFRIEVERANVKFKLSQNHPQPNRQSVCERLAQSQREAARDIAALMRMRLDAPTAGE